MTDAALTVMFATRNGESVLPRTLRGYCRLESPPCRWKLVVINNGSEDATEEVLASFSSRLPLEIQVEGIPGKNRALNSGLSATEGALTVITDDDAVPDRSFLRAWSSYLTKQTSYDLFGGGIDLLFDTPPPEWLKEMSQLDMMFACRDLPEGPITPDGIFGPNMAVRRAVFTSGFKFNENIGPNGSDPNYPMGSETEFCCRVAQGGARAWFAKEPRVSHIVRGSQLTKDAWIRRAYRHGRGVARRERESNQAVLGRVERSLMHERALALRYWLQMRSPFPRMKFNALWAYHWHRGFQEERGRP